MQLDQLIRSCIKKDRKAQEQLYTIYKNKLFPVCLKYCRTHAEAEDHLHDTFIIIFETIKKYNKKGSFEGWMKRIAINKAIDNYKKNKEYGLDKTTEEKLSDDTNLENDDLPPSWEALIALIQSLPNQYRIVFNLYEIEEYSHKQIATLLNISENTSKSNLHRAKAILKSKITKSNSTSKTRKSHAR